MANPKVIVFLCNWNAYHGLETAGAKHLGYPPTVHPLKVMCLGQVSPGIVLNAFENGVDGVLMLGCPPSKCHFEFGNRRAEEVFQETKALTLLMGYRDEQFQLDWIPAGDGQGFVDKVQTFVTGLNKRGK